MSRFIKVLLFSTTLMMIVPFIVYTPFFRRVSTFYLSQFPVLEQVLQMLSEGELQVMENLLKPPSLLKPVYLGLCPTLGYVVALLYLYMKRPLFFIERKVSMKIVTNESIQEIMRDLCIRMGIATIPRVFMTNFPSPLSYGLSPTKSIILIPEDFIKLNKNEQESILAHELCHVKDDSEVVSIHLTIAWKLVFILIGLLLFVIYWVVMAIAYPVVYYRQPTPEEIKQGIISVYYVSTLPHLIPHLEGIVLWAVAALLFITMLRFSLSVSGLPPLFRLDFREYYADLASSLVTKRPLTLAESLLKIRHSILGNQRHSIFKPTSTLAKISLLGIQYKLRENISKWSDIFQLGLMDRENPPDLYRYCLLALTNRMLNSQIFITIKGNQLRIPWRPLLWAKSPLARRSSFVREFNALSKKEREEITTYMMCHLTDFNLRSCANAVGVSEMKVLVFILILLSYGVIDVLNPSFKEAYQEYSERYMSVILY